MAQCPSRLSASSVFSVSDQPEEVKWKRFVRFNYVLWRISTQSGWWIYLLRPSLVSLVWFIRSNKIRRAFIAIQVSRGLNQEVRLWLALSGSELFFTREVELSWLRAPLSSFHLWCWIHFSSYVKVYHAKLEAMGELVRGLQLLLIFSNW